MRSSVAGVFVLLVLLAVPGAAVAAQPAAEWPSASEVLQGQPGLRPAEAACIARYYRGRLSRKAWRTQYYDLSSAQKVVTDAGPESCMSAKERLAAAERLFTAIVGKKFAGLHCVAVKAEALTRPQRNALTTRALWLRTYDGIFRDCRMMGTLYASVGSDAHLVLTPGERACTNRLGSTEPLLYNQRAKPSTAHLTAIGTVFDRCVGRASEEAMYRYIFRNFTFPAKIPCIARRITASVTFVELLTEDAGAKARVQKTTTACLAAS